MPMERMLVLGKVDVRRPAAVIARESELEPEEKALLENGKWQYTLLGHRCTHF